MAAKTPTNTDIFKLLGVIQDENMARHNENSKRLDGIESQVKYTNGQVRSLNEWRSNVIAVEEDRARRQSNMQAVKIETGNQWDWKTVLAILLTLATAIVGVAGVTK